MHHAHLLARNANELAPNASFQKVDGELERIPPRNADDPWKTTREDEAVMIVMETTKARTDTILDVANHANDEEVDRGGLRRVEVEVMNWIVEEGLIEGSVIDWMTAGKVAEVTPAIGTMTMVALGPNDIERAAIRRLREEDTSEVIRRPRMCLTGPQVSSS